MLGLPPAGIALATSDGPRTQQPLSHRCTMRNDRSPRLSSLGTGLWLLLSRGALPQTMTGEPSIAPGRQCPGSDATEPWTTPGAPGRNDAVGRAHPTTTGTVLGTVRGLSSLSSSSSSFISLAIRRPCGAKDGLSAKPIQSMPRSNSAWDISRASKKTDIRPTGLASCDFLPCRHRSCLTAPGRPSKKGSRTDAWPTVLSIKPSFTSCTVTTG
mmetsp:Transcript_18/g.55  ORF Transcript_18/g.55 Transcript_18/m.55 type:complete len:213 (-) Transcript_18:398-1036(-)